MLALFRADQGRWGIIRQSIPACGRNLYPTMSDPFNILGSELDVPRTFDEAVRDAVTRFEISAARFNELYTQVPEEAYTEEEWRAVERAATDVEEAVERAEEGYVAVQYDSHAWYRILENLATIDARLQSAIGLMELALEREAGRQP